MVLRRSRNPHTDPVPMISIALRRKCTCSLRLAPVWGRVAHDRNTSTRAATVRSDSHRVSAAGPRPRSAGSTTRSRSGIPFELGCGRRYRRRAGDHHNGLTAGSGPVSHQCWPSPSAVPIDRRTRSGTSSGWRRTGASGTAGPTPKRPTTRRRLERRCRSRATSLPPSLPPSLPQRPLSAFATVLYSTAFVEDERDDQAEHLNHTANTRRSPPGSAKSR